MSFPPLNRRSFISGLGALGGAALLQPRISWSRDGSTLRIRADRDIKVLDPAFGSGGIEHIIARATSASLTTFERDGTANWRPYGAKTIEQVDDLTIRFTLHEGIMWTNGFGEVTTEDVKYSFERVASEELDSPWRDYWVQLDRVDIIDRYTGEIVLKEPYIPVWTISLSGEAGNLVCMKAVEEAGGRFETLPPATCGPYFIKKWSPKEKIVLEAHPGWPLEKPKFDQVTYLPIDDGKTAEIAYDAGELDYTTVSVSSLEVYRKNLPDSGKLLERAALNYVWLGLNVEHPKLRDIRVRKAIQHAVDVDAIIQGAYGGLATRAHGIVPPALLGHRDRSTIEKRDVSKARELLAEAGQADGLTLTLSILNIAERSSAAQIIQANLAEAGINVEILPYESGTFWNLGHESEGEDWKDLQLLLQRYSTTVDPVDCTAWHTPEQAGKWNWQRFNDVEFGELHKQAMLEPDTEKRRAMYLRMQDLMEESGAYLFIAHEVAGAIHAADIDPAVGPQFREMPHFFEPV